MRCPVEHAPALEMAVPSVNERPGIHRQRAAAVDADEQRRLVGNAVPAVDFKPEVVIAQEVPHRLLDEFHERLVRPPGDRRLGDAARDEACDWVLRGLPVALSGRSSGVLACARRRTGAHRFTLDVAVRHLGSSRSRCADPRLGRLVPPGTTAQKPGPELDLRPSCAAFGPGYARPVSVPPRCTACETSHAGC